MHEQAYLATLEFVKGAIDRNDTKRMKYWLEVSMNMFTESKDPLPVLSAEYRNKAVTMMVEECR